MIKKSKTNNLKKKKIEAYEAHCNTCRGYGKVRSMIKGSIEVIDCKYCLGIGKFNKVFYT